MADQDRMMAALRNADAAGDTEAATRIAAMIRQDKPTTVGGEIAPTAQPDGKMAWGDVASQAFKNIPSSAVQFGEDIIQPIVHPVNTAKGLYKVASGGVQKLIPGDQGNEPAFDAVTQFFKDRYGGIENLKKTIAADPVGFAADISTVLTGGGALAAKAPGMIGKTGRMVETVGKAVDPLRAAVKGTGAVASKVIEPAISNVVGSLGTHTGAESIRQAAKAGFAGGERGAAFAENMRGMVPAEKVVTDAKTALDAIRQERGAAYRAGMKGVAQSTDVLDFGKIDSALNEVKKIGTYKGKVLDRSASETWQKVSEVVDEWRQAEPKDFHTAEGMDALKKAIGDVRDSTQYGSPSRKVADTVYHTIKKEIVQQAPEYSKVMGSYETASDLLKEIETTLSLNPKASVDTKLRKLQSVLRNNANTNYGRRVELTQKLTEAGADTLMPALAGQMMQDFAPRGLGRVVAGGNVIGGVVNPSLLAALPFQSPRLVGEAAYASGQGARLLAPGVNRAIPLGLPAFQAGRISDEEKRKKTGRR